MRLREWQGERISKSMAWHVSIRDGRGLERQRFLVRFF